MKKILIIMAVCGQSLALMAQQEPQFNQYMFNRVYLNPAAAGVSGAICVNGFGRSQWIGMTDEYDETINPRTFGLAADMPVYAIKSGVGLSFAYNRLGYEQDVDVRLHYAYHQVFPNNHMLSGGLSFALKNKTIGYADLKPFDEDPAIPVASESGMITDLGLGFHYNIPRKFYAGVSVSNLMGSDAEIGGVEFGLARHYYAMAGYHIQVLDRKRRIPWEVTPGFLLKAASGSVQLDLNAIVTYNDLLWGGVVFRVERAAGLMAGIKYYGVMAGVSYDYTFNNVVSGKSRNSIEFFVKYCYPIFPGVIKRSAYNTRNL